MHFKGSLLCSYLTLLMHNYVHAGFANHSVMELSEECKER